MSYNLRNIKKYKLILIVSSICFISTFLGFKIYEQNNSSDDRNEMNSKVELFEDTNNDIDFSYITLSVTDYEQGIQQGNYLEWQSRYNIVTSTSSLYIDGSISKEGISISNVDEIISFHPESKTDLKDIKSKVDDNEYGIIHWMSLKESEQYAGSLLQDGYVLRRKIITPTYAELYLLDKDDNTLRLIAFREYMLAANLTGDDLPDIESYFK